MPLDAHHGLDTGFEHVVAAPYERLHRHGVQSVEHLARCTLAVERLVEGDVVAILKVGYDIDDSRAAQHVIDRAGTFEHSHSVGFAQCDGKHVQCLGVEFTEVMEAHRHVGRTIRTDRNGGLATHDLIVVFG